MRLSIKCRVYCVELCFIISILNIIVCMIYNQYIINNTSGIIFILVIVSPYALALKLYDTCRLKYINNRIHHDDQQHDDQQHYDQQHYDQLDITKNYIICINPCSSGVMGIKLVNS